MNKAEAVRILGVGPEDGQEMIRKKYHTLLHRCHPDALDRAETEQIHRGRNDHVQRLIEAYALLRDEKAEGKSGASSSAGANLWCFPQNPNAWCDRRLILEDELFGEEIRFQAGARGRYLWDPEVESFTLFLRSVSEAAIHLLEQRQLPSDYGKLRFALTHLIIQEFVFPQMCLPKVCSLDQTSGMYRLHGHLIPETTAHEDVLRQILDTKPTDKSSLQLCAHGSRLYLEYGQRIAGRVSFEEDYLYYVITPLFLQHAAATGPVVLTPLSKGSMRCKLETTVKVNFEAFTDQTTKINREISRLLG